MRLMLLFIALAVIPSAYSAPLLIGAAATKITPATGTPMAGYYFERPAQSVHDDLYAKAIVLEVDGQSAALVALDLITTTRDLVDDARVEINRITRIPAANIMISATHAHTGPVISRPNEPGGSSELSRLYRAELPAKIAESVRLAQSRLAPGNAFAAHGHQDSIAFNRRFHMKDGSVGWNPGKLNPNIIKPAGTIDPDVPFLYFESLAGKPIATYVNYAVHLDNVGGPHISADLPATLSRCLADFKSPELVTLFTAGCCGDVNHINVKWKEPQTGFGNAARMGTILAAEVLESWPSLQAIPSATIRVKSEIVSLPLPIVQPGDLAKANALITRHKSDKSHPPAFLETVWAYKILDLTARNGQPWEVEVQVIALGRDVAWVSLPGEIFVELGLGIKQDSPFPHTIIAELTNGVIGYIPSRRAYAQGNYEVISARCAQGSGEKLVETALRLLHDLHHLAR